MGSSSLLTVESLSTDTTPRSSTSLDDLSINEHLHKLSIDKHLDTPPWILHHILERQLSCELPLRIMFSFNAGQKLPTLKQAQQWWQYEKKGKLIIEFLSSLDKITPSVDETPLEDLQNPSSGSPEAFDPIHDPRDRFMDAGNDFLLAIDFAANLGGDRRQSHGLPTDFVQDMCLNRFFTKEYKRVNFDQALTGMDYLRDLEVTRRASLRDAAQRLGITKENWRHVLSEDPDAKKWVEYEQAQELEIEIYYAQIFTDLRIWTMVNVLESQPFYKPNTVAMLNTLFPPSVRELPNERINAKVLYGYRATFYRYILDVDANGPSALKPLLQRLLRPGSRHSWQETRRNLEAYLERADLMITQANAVYDVAFFRDNGSFSSWAEGGTKSFLNDYPPISNSMASFSDRFSGSSTPRPPARTFDSTPALSKPQRPRNASTPVERKISFEPPESPWSSQTLVRKSGQSSHSATPGLANRRPSIALADTNSISSRNRSRTLSRPTTPFVESGSEAAHHISFTRPITPFEDKRREIVTLRDTISSRPATSLELSRNLKLSAEMGSRLGNRPGSRATTFRPEKSRLASVSQLASGVRLPSDNMEFLKHPYDPFSPSLSRTTLKTKPSLGSLFLRKKSSVGSQAGTMRDKFNHKNPLGITLRPSTSVEPFPRFSIEGTISSNEVTVGSNESTHGSESECPRFSNDGIAGLELPKLKKQVSWGHLEETDSSISLSCLQELDTRSTAYSHRSKGLGLGGSGLSEVAENSFFNRRLKKQSSMPNIRLRNIGEDTEEIFVATGNEYLRFEVFDTPRLPPKRRVRKTKSIVSMVSGKSNNTITAGGRGKKPRKSSLFRREPTDEVITSKDVSEPFPVDLQRICGTFLCENEEFRSKEYTRKWFLEESRARKFDLNRPAGDPIKEPEKKGFFMKRKTPPSNFELPRATPKPLVRPNRQRFDSIFPRREVVKKKKPRTHVPIDISKYTRYPGMQNAF